MSDDRPKLQPLSPSQRAALEEALAHYEKGITPAIATMLQARGIDRTIGLQFRLGVVRDPFPGHNLMRGWIVIPYLDKDRKPLTMRFRNPEQHGTPKYLGLVDEPTRVFNIGAIHRAKDEIHITEGEFDAMVLQRVGLDAVAIAGANGWKSHNRRMMAGFNKVYVWGDPDDAGAEFARKVTQSLRQASAVRLRDGDVTDTYKAGGAKAILQLIER